MKKQNFSMSHFKVLSVWKYLDSFVNYMEWLKYDFSIIGSTDTWLKDEDCDLFMIPGYRMVENIELSVLVEE